MKVVLALDFVRHGGADLVLEELHGMWPEAPVYTLLAEKHAQYAGWDIRSSWLQGKLPSSMYRWPFPLYPRMVDRIRIPEGTELLLSTSVSWFKGLQAPPGAKHLCYICRPMMFAYHRQEDFLARYPRVLRPLLRALIRPVAEWDQRTADRPDRYYSISQYTADRVHEAYGIDSEVIHPPVRTEDFEAAGRKAAPGGYFLTMSRLETYKRIDVIVEACTRLGLPLKVVGMGKELKRLRALAGPTVEFLGWVPREELPALVAGCRAFLFAAEEDFGIAPVEAQAAGRPVVAFGRGGCLETVVAGRTGLFFEEQHPDSLVAALEALPQEAQEGQDGFDPDEIRANAQRFSAGVFREKMAAAARRLLAGDGPEPVPAKPGKVEPFGKAESDSERPKTR